jgi:hypothetical protein
VLRSASHRANLTLCDSFALPDPKMKVGLPVASCLVTRCGARALAGSVPRACRA